MAKKALLIVDMQNDFVEGGSLAVTGGKSIVPIINKMIDHAAANNFKIIGTKDFHPKEHISFASNKEFYSRPEFKDYIKYQEPFFWPDHCIIGSKGGEIVEGLKQEKIEKFFYKGSNCLIDSYSAFYTNGHVINQHFIQEYLKNNDVDTIFVCGLAEDFCVMWNALDAASEGYKVYLVEDATKPVFPDKVNEALENYKKAGVKIITSDEFVRM